MATTKAAARDDALIEALAALIAALRAQPSDETRRNILIEQAQGALDRASGISREETVDGAE